MTTLRKAQIENNLEAFIKEHEGEECEKEALQRYIDASATPLDSHKEGHSKSDAERFDDCK